MSAFLPSLFRQAEQQIPSRSTYSFPQHQPQDDGGHNVHISFCGSVLAIMVGFIILETLLMAVGSVCRWCFRPGNLEDYGWVFDDEDALIDGHDGIHMSSLIHTARSGSNMHLDSNGKTRRRKVHINNHPQPHTMPQAHESSSSVCCVICLDELTSASTDVVKFSNCCQSLFHQSCLQQWLRSRSECPCCRQPASQFEDADAPGVLQGRQSVLSNTMRWLNPRSMLEEREDLFCLFTLR
mmetsp:Transcript_1730/g.4773  ORF Transcript_1730/g.4773 Transcript_1730/m.4773 type:complete len:239 (-) Transcript_1730:485-1201(-)